jgi:hypothetical protein
MKCWLSALAVCLVVSVASGCGGGGDTHEPPPDYGAPCNGSCMSGLACLPTDDHLGYCTTTCDSAACPTGTTCNAAFGASVCFLDCMTDAVCHTGQQCWAGHCQPACSFDAECGTDGSSCAMGRCRGPECSASTPCAGGLLCSGGHCVMPTDGGPLMLGDGATCRRSIDCRSGFCLPADRGGVCTIHCGTSDPCFAEPFTSVCGAASVDGTVGAFCLPFGSGAGINGSECTGDADCGNLTCVDGQCRDACTSQTQCLLGQMCTSVSYMGGSFMGCGYPSGPATGTEVRVLDLGTFAVASMMGTPDILFATPPETVSVTLRARYVSGDDLDMVFYQVFDATNTRIFSADQMDMYVDQTIRWYPGDTASATAMLIPNCTVDRYTYRPGRVRFSVAAFAAPPATTGLIHMQVDAVEVVGTPPSTGSIHLRLHFLNVGVTAASAPTDARLAQFMNRYEQILAQVGITIADVAYVDINAPSLDIIDSSQGESSELAQLFRMSSGTTEDILNLFLVQNITAGGTGEFNTLGIAGGIPGPPRIQGSSHSGVVIAYDPGVVGPSGYIPGTVAAHESGHYLGLFHTTENGRRCGAGETPSASDQCVPFGGTDVIGDTTYGDSSNLMNFAIAPDGSNGLLSAGQGFVERHNPLTQ